MKQDFYRTTKEYFQRVALNTRGIYDAKNPLSLKWQYLIKEKALTIIENLNGKTLLDIGCGNGEFTINIGLKYRSAKVIGLDYVEDMVKIGNKNKDKPKNVFFLTGDAKSLPIKSKQVDVLTAIFFLHHIYPDDIENVLSEITRVAKDRVIIEFIECKSLFFLAHLFLSRIKEKAFKIQCQRSEKIIDIMAKHRFKVNQLHRFNVMGFTKGFILAEFIKNG